MNLKERIAEYSDFPKKGILFRDFSPILRDSAALSFVVEEFSKQYNPEDVDVFVGIESRGFILACALAQRYNKGMVIVEKVKAKVTGFAFIIELTELNGIKEINNYKIVSLVRY